MLYVYQNAVPCTSLLTKLNYFIPFTGNTISHAMEGVHKGGVLSLCFTKEGNLLSGGKDRRILEWDESYEPTGQEAQVCLQQNLNF